MKFFVSEITGVNMSLLAGITDAELLTKNVAIGDSAWGSYTIKPVDAGDGDLAFQVLNNKGEQVNVEWATYEGAAACAELLAEGYLKE